jgi:hypothetical protein
MRTPSAGRSTWIRQVVDRVRSAVADDPLLAVLDARALHRREVESVEKSMKATVGKKAYFQLSDRG